LGPECEWGAGMLSEALAALASTGGTALLAAMITDGWEGIRSRFARLLGRGNLRDTQVAEAQLDQARAQLARLSGADLKHAQAELVIVWGNRLADLLEQDPSAEAELRQLIADIQTQVEDTVHQYVVGSVHAEQAVHGHGVYNSPFGDQDASHQQADALPSDDPWGGTLSSSGEE
jgi:hypothetical protein